MKRLPIRWQVTLAFAAVSALVLLAAGAFLYLRFESELRQTVDTGLRSRAGEVTALIRQSDSGLSEAGRPILIEDGAAFAQILTTAGTVVDATPRARTPLLTSDELARARSGSLFVEGTAGGVDGEHTRLLAVPVRAGGRQLTVVVGASLDDTEEALRNLLLLESVGLASALLLASAAGYWVSGLALRPVEAMRTQAEQISGEPDRRLPVPAVDDEIGRLGATLNAMLNRIEAALAAQGAALARERRFVADASHELRTPLTILRSEIDVALLADRSHGELLAALASAGEEATRLSRLAEDLLVLARTDDGGLPIRAETVPIGALLERVADRRRGGPKAVGREIVVDVAPGLCVTADPLRLDQAVDNLVDNALRHGAGTIKVTGRREGDGVQVAVRDHGPGFPPVYLDRAFERFARPDASRTGGGSGLGLAIVSAIAETHGGSAAAFNADPGARVVITLPSQSTLPSGASVAEAPAPPT